MQRPLLILILFALIPPSCSILYCATDDDCGPERKCVLNECMRFVKKNCLLEGGECPRKNHCCKIQGYGDKGVCLRNPLSPNSVQVLGEGQQCRRDRNNCNFCQCQPGLVCLQSYIVPNEPTFTCQRQQPSVCTSHLQCESSYCCSSGKCKPKKRLGETCFPRSDPESNLLCQGFCVDGTECRRNAPNHYTCQTIESDPTPTCNR